MLDDRARDTDGVAFLEGVEPDCRCRHLTRDDDHRNRVHVGSRDACHSIRGTRTRCYQGNTNIAGGPRIAIRRVHGSLLMAHQHMPDGVLFEQRVVDIQHCAARIAPKVLDTFGLHTANENFRAIQLWR